MKLFMPAVLAWSCVASAYAITNVTTQAQLDKILNDPKKPYTVVKFWKNPCEPCEHLAPYFEKVAAKLGNKVNFVAIEGSIDQTKALTRNYHISGYPKTLYFKNGQQLPKHGTRNVNSLERDIRAAFSI